MKEHEERVEKLRAALRAARAFIVNTTTATHGRARLMDKIDGALEAAASPKEAAFPAQNPRRAARAQAQPAPKIARSA